MGDYKLRLAERPKGLRVSILPIDRARFANSVGMEVNKISLLYFFDGNIKLSPLKRFPLDCLEQASFTTN